MIWFTYGKKLIRTSRFYYLNISKIPHLLLQINNGTILTNLRRSCLEMRLSDFSVGRRQTKFYWETILFKMIDLGVREWCHYYADTNIAVRDVGIGSFRRDQDQYGLWQVTTQPLHAGYRHLSTQRCHQPFMNCTETASVKSRALDKLTTALSRLHYSLFLSVTRKYEFFLEFPCGFQLLPCQHPSLSLCFPRHCFWLITTNELDPVRKQLANV